MSLAVVSQLAPGRSRLQPLFGLLLVVAGCSLAGSAPSAKATRTCRSDSDCSAARHETCRAPDGDRASTSAGGICVIPAAHSDRQVYFEIRPVSADSSLPVQIGPVDLADGQNHKLVLPLPVSAQGSVVDGTNTAVQRATVQFVSVPRIPYRPQLFQTSTLDASSGMPGIFTQVLPQGTYTVTILPPMMGGIAPPPQVYTKMVDSSGNLGQLQVPAQTDLLYLTGTLLDNNMQAVEGASVTAIDASLTARNVISQPAQTDQNGAFRLAIKRPPDSVSPVQISLQIGAGANGLIFPTFSGLPAMSVDVPPRSTNPAMPSNTVSLASVVVQLPGSVSPVSGKVLDSAGNPVSGMQVKFQTVRSAQTSSGPFSFSATATSADDGSFQVNLYPADYVALAIPPDALASVDTRSGMAGSEYANIGLCGLTPSGGGTIVHVDPAQPLPVLLACETRQEISAGVISHGTYVPGVTVDAFREPTPELPNGLHFSTTTDASGHFSLPLVSGTYDLNLQPSDSSELPFRWIPAAIQVSGMQPQDRGDFLLDDPFQLYGKLVAAGTNQPIEALIDAYAADATSTVLIGHGHAMADGTYSIVLPTSAPNALPATATPAESH